MHGATIKTLSVILRVRVGYTVKWQASSPTETKWEGFLQHMALPPEGAISQHYAVFLALCPRVCEPHVPCMGESRAICLVFRADVAEIALCCVDRVKYFHGNVFSLVPLSPSLSISTCRLRVLWSVWNGTWWLKPFQLFVNSLRVCVCVTNASGNFLQNLRHWRRCI